MFGSPEITPGGRALKFYSSIRVEIRRSEQLKIGTDIVGNRTKIKVVKNKMAPPFKRSEVDLVYGEGISRPGEILDLAVENELVKKSGSWFSYENNKIGQGRENVKQYLKEHPDLLDNLEKQIRELMHI